MSHSSKNYNDKGGDLTVIGGELKINGGKITDGTGTQAVAITKPTGGTTVDAECRTAVNSIIDALKAVGITL